MDGYELLQQPRTRTELRCAIAAQGRSRADDAPTRAVARVLERCELLVDPRDRAVAKPMLEVGFWEWWVTRAVADCMVPGRTCVDVGANAGYFTALFAALGAGAIVAIEPHPALAQNLRDSAARNGWRQVRVLQCAAGERRERLHLHVQSDDNLGGSFMTKDASDRTIAADSAPLDELLRDVGPIQVLKIDCEGAEPRIWRGMQDVLRRNPDVHVFAELIVNDDALRWLEDVMAAGFPLRHVAYDGTIAPLTIEQARTHEIWMLYLHRGS